VFAHDGATCVEYASISSQWKIGAVMILSICFDAMSWRHCVACGLMRDKLLY